MDDNFTDHFGYEPKLPEDIREIFMWLCQDVVHIQASWNFYYELFTSNDYQEIKEILATSFLVIEESVRTDITMSIARISDAAQTTGKDNLTFKKLAQKCKDVDGLDAMVESFVSACEPIRKLRHKRTGHNDLNTRIDPLNNPLPGVGPNEINQILRQAKEILNIVYGHYASEELYFEAILWGGAKTLLFYLKTGKEYQEQKRRRILSKPQNT